MKWLNRLLRPDEETEQIPPSLQAGARDFVDRVAPSDLQIGRDSVAMSTQGVVTRTWWIEDLPGQMTFESLDPILHFPGRVVVSLLVEPIPPAEAMQAREAFLTAASAFVLPVVEIDGHAIGDGAPGPVARAFRAHYIAEARKS